jgi:hypothetical protein
MYRKDKHLTLQSRLERRRQIDPVTNCWLWTGNINNGGHGILHWPPGKGSQSVSRLAMHVYSGFDLSSRRVICHKRECPNPHCFNPEHLYVGTRRQNILDAMALGYQPGWGKRKQE